MFRYVLFALAFAVFSSLDPSAAEAAVENVVWTSLVNTTATGNSLRKTSGCDGCGDAGAASSQQIMSGDGYVEFSIAEPGKLVIAGLGNGNADTSAADIEFGVRTNGPGGGAAVYERGLYVADLPHAAATDVFRVAVSNGVVTYSHNGSPIYTSQQIATYPLLLDATIASLDGVVANAVISGAGFPGGFIELATDPADRPTLTNLPIPAVRGKFSFRTPITPTDTYNTDAIRITIPDDCLVGVPQDCVNYVGYAFWRNMNNHVGQNTMLIFLGLRNDRGGQGPTIFEYDKTNDSVTKRIGPMFDAAASWSYLNNHSGDGWYFSATLPSDIYVYNGAGTEGNLFRRYNVDTRVMTTVFDINNCPASICPAGNKFVWEMHSSANDAVHAGTVRLNDGLTYPKLGCVVYTTGFSFYAPALPPSPLNPERHGGCAVDKSGRWLVITEHLDDQNGWDSRIIDLQTGNERQLLDENGGFGHADMGYGYIVAADNWAPDPNTLKVWDFSLDPLQGVVVTHNTNWFAEAANHVTHLNANGSTPLQQQYACGSNASRVSGARGNEIVCFRLGPHTPLDVLVVAPAMVNLDAPGGGDDYGKLPKGNLDITGQYFIWTSNNGSDRLDAYIVKVPSHLLNP